MPFSPGYSRTKNFAPLGTFLPGDINAIQDDLGGALAHRAPLQVVAALPGSPTDGQEIVYQNATMAGLGIAWRLKYRSGSASAYKWEYIGGSPWVAEVTTSETTAAGAFADLATVGPSITLPLAGDYAIGLSALIKHSVAGATSYMSYAIGGTAAVVADAIRVDQEVANMFKHTTRAERPKLALAASTAIVAKYNTTATGTYADRTLSVRPIRLG